MVFYVAPLVGARIEIRFWVLWYPLLSVAPLVGARIEIDKYAVEVQNHDVAPLVGARIEITGRLPHLWQFLCRSPRGSAD